MEMQTCRESSAQSLKKKHVVRNILNTDVRRKKTCTLLISRSKNARSVKTQGTPPGGGFQIAADWAARSSPREGVAETEPSGLLAPEAGERRRQGRHPLGGLEALRLSLHHHEVRPEVEPEGEAVPLQRRVLPDHPDAFRLGHLLHAADTRRVPGFLRDLDHVSRLVRDRYHGHRITAAHREAAAASAEA